MVGSASSPSSSSPLVSLTSLSFFIIKFLVWVSPTPTPRTKIFIDVPVDDAGSELSGGMSSGLSVAVQPKRGFSVFMCFPADMSTCCMLCPSSLPFLTSRASILMSSGSYSPSSRSRSVPNLSPAPVSSDLPVGSVRYR